MKLFKTDNLQIITSCQEEFGFRLPIARRTKKLVTILHFRVQIVVYFCIISLVKFLCYNIIIIIIIIILYNYKDFRKQKR